MIFEHEQIHSYLQAVLAERQNRSHTYSLRAFARDLGLAPSYLSDLLRRKKGVSVEGAYSIASQLKLKERETQYLCKLAELTSCKGDEHEERIRAQMQAMHPKRTVKALTTDAFAMISEWYHLPILELLHIDGTKWEAGFISQRLGITKVQAAAAMDRLERLGLIKSQDGKTIKATPDVYVESKQKNIAMRKFHKEMLTKAIDAVDSQSSSERLLSGESLAIHPSLLPRAMELISSCMDNISTLFANGPAPTETYQLAIQLFRLTRAQVGLKKTNNTEKKNEN